MSFKENKSIISIFAVILLLLFVSIVLAMNSRNETAIKSINPYVKGMPSIYTRAFKNNGLTTDSIDDVIKGRSIHTYLEDNNLDRYLAILIESPSKMEIANDFNIKIHPSSKVISDDSLKVFKLTNNAVTYNFNNKEYGVFKMPLPIIDIDKIEITQVHLNKRKKPWKKYILNPFEKTDTSGENIANSDFKGEEYKPLIYKALIIKMLEAKNIAFLDYGYKLVNTKLKAVNKTIDVYIQEKQSVLTINNPNNFWKSLEKKDTTIHNLINIKGHNKADIKKSIDDYITDNTSLIELFNIDKLSEFYAITQMFAPDCINTKLQFIYNTENENLEPLFNYNECLNEERRFLNPLTIKNTDFIETYTQALQSYTSLNIYEEFVEDSNDLLSEIKLINKYYPNMVFDLDQISINQMRVWKSLNQSTVLKPELISINNKKMVVSIFNVSYYPVNIIGLNHEGKKNVITLNTPKQILSNQRDTITFNLPRSFENLFVSKKKKVTGFLLHKHIYDLYISYATLGLDNQQTVSIIPYQEKEATQEDLFRNKNAVNNHRDIIINETEKLITFSKDSVIINSALVIPKGYLFKLKPGAIINILDGGKIISYAALDFKGTKQKPIKVFSSDKKGQGVLVLSDGVESNLKHVTFDHLTNPSHGNWSVTGAVTFYESPVRLKHVSVKNNRCEDALNIVRTNFTMDSCFIGNTQSDAFDGDFVKGTIANCTFDNLGNDAIDVSGSDLIIKKVVVSNAGDKGLSAGEDSKMTIDNVEISNSEIAIAGKDLSIVNARNLKISNTKLGFTAFQKKPEFGPSNITVKGVIMDGVETKYLIESSSSLFVDGEKIETSQNVKDRMYGVEFGRSSAETRNSQ